MRSVWCSPKLRHLRTAKQITKFLQVLIFFTADDTDTDQVDFTIGFKIQFRAVVAEALSLSSASQGAKAFSQVRGNNFKG